MSHRIAQQIVSTSFLFFVLERSGLKLCSEVLKTGIYLFLWENTCPAVPLLEISHLKSPWLTVIIFMLNSLFPTAMLFFLWDYSQSSKLFIVPAVGAGFYVLGFFLSILGG